MTESQNKNQNDDNAVSRRDLLKTAGAAGAVSVIGTGAATAQPPDRPGRQPDRHIVGVEPGRADQARKQADAVLKTLNFGDIGQAVVGRWPEPALQGLQRNPHVRYIEEDGPIWLEGHGGEDLDWGADRIDAEIAHEAGHTGAGINVAIIDSGIDTRHDELVDNLHDTLHFAPNVCDSGDCPEDWHDDNGHGTLVAGIVAASHDTGNDPFGVAPEATLHAVKVFGGTSEEGFQSDLAAGLEWVADNDIDVANMSLGSSHSQTVEDAMEYAVNNDVVLVSSAGNEQGGDVTFPGGYPQDIAVSGITELDELSTISSTGPEVDIGAPTAPAAGSGQPGRGILTTRLDGGTFRTGGTSSAAPHVAGAAALLLANGTAPNDVQDVLEDTAEDLGLDDEEQGAGLVDVANALGLDSANDLLEVETLQPGVRLYEQAAMVGRLNHLVGSDSAEVFFEFREQGESTWERTGGEEIDPDEPIAPILDNQEFYEQTAEALEQDTRYEYRAAATVSEDNEGWESTEHGEVKVLTTLGYPIADFAVVTEPPVRGEPVDFDASESFAPTDRHTGIAREIDEYVWDFGDGTEVTTDDPLIEHTYDEGGDKTVTLRVIDEDGGSDDDLSVHQVDLTVHIRVAVDIKPSENGSNPINLRGETNVPVAVLHTEDFDSPAELDPGTVRFGAPATVDAGNGAAPIHEGGHIEDVNDSGDDDWHCHFQTGETGFDRDDDEGKLVGETHDGVPVFGVDDVRIVGRGGS